jgi:hypothetical protein
MRLYKLYVMISTVGKCYNMVSIQYNNRVYEITQIWRLDAATEAEVRTQEVHPPARLRVQTRVARTQASYRIAR